MGVLRAYGGGTIFGQAYGDGPVKVVWMHGWQRTGADFEAAAARLASTGVASVSLDLPGFGASPVPPRGGGAALYADLVLPVLKDIGEGPLVLVGHSFGGRVATVLAADHHELVKALVLTGAPLLRAESPRRAPRAYRLVRILHRRHLLSDARMERARQKYGSSDYRRANGLVRDVLVASVNESYEGQLARIAAPVVLVWGARDTEVPVAVGERARDLLVRSSSVEWVVLEETGHLVPTERPVALADLTHRLAVGR